MQIMLMDHYVSILCFVQVTFSCIFWPQKLQIFIISPLFFLYCVYNCTIAMLALNNKKMGDMV